VRRIMWLVTVAVVLAAMLVVMSVPAFAAVPSGKGNLVGEVFSSATPGEEKSTDCLARPLRGAFGEDISNLAQEPNSEGSIARVACEGTGV
jgi:hypothetical protein